MRSRRAFLEVAMTEPRARPSASRTLFTVGRGKAWPGCSPRAREQPWEHGLSLSTSPVPPEVPQVRPCLPSLPRDPQTCPCLLSLPRDPHGLTLTWLLNGHHLKATGHDMALFPLHRCQWPVEGSGQGWVPQLSRTVELGRTPKSPSALTSHLHCCCHHHCSAPPELHWHQEPWLLQGCAQLESPPGPPSSFSFALSLLFFLEMRSTG